MVERQLPKLNVEGSSPFARSTHRSSNGGGIPANSGDWAQRARTDPARPASPGSCTEMQGSAATGRWTGPVASTEDLCKQVGRRGDPVPCADSGGQSLGGDSSGAKWTPRTTSELCASSSGRTAGCPARSSGLPGSCGESSTSQVRDGRPIRAGRPTGSFVGRRTRLGRCFHRRGGPRGNKRRSSAAFAAGSNASDPIRSAIP